LPILQNDKARERRTEPEFVILVAGEQRVESTNGIEDLPAKHRHDADGVFLLDDVPQGQSPDA
jgi:hypothetical protein